MSLDYRLVAVARTDDFDFYTTVLGATFAGGVRRDGAGFAFTFSVNTIGWDPLGYQVVFNGSSTTLGQALVVFSRTCGVCVTRCNKRFKLDVADLFSDLV